MRAHLPCRPAVTSALRCGPPTGYLQSLWIHFQRLLDVMDGWRVMRGHVRPYDVPSLRPRRQQEACHVWDEFDNPFHLPPRVLPLDYRYFPLVPDI